jgi:hypothetical protein
MSRNTIAYLDADKPGASSFKPPDPKSLESVGGKIKDFSCRWRFIAASLSLGPLRRRQEHSVA